MKDRPVAWGVMEGGHVVLVFDTKKQATEYNRYSLDKGKVVPLYTKPPEVK